MAGLSRCVKQGHQSDVYAYGDLHIHIYMINLYTYIYINRHGDTVGISEAPLRYPHPVVGRASVGARASCLSSHRTRVCSARRGCHLCDVYTYIYIYYIYIHILEVRRDKHFLALRKTWKVRVVYKHINYANI